MMGIRAWGLSSLAAVAVLSAGFAVHAADPTSLPADLMNLANNAATKAISEIPGMGAPTTQATTQAASRPAGILLGSGVIITNTASGGGAQADDTVYILYTGRVQSTGAVFDSSNDHRPVQPMRFTLGPSGGVLPGFWEGIIGMQIGDKRTIDIPPQLAYGANPPTAKIPPNAALEFDVQLVGITRPLPAAGK